MEDLTEIGTPLRGGVLDSISRHVGESPEAIQRALKGIVPTTSYAIADYGSTETGARSLLECLSSGRFPSTDATGLTRSLTEPGGPQHLLSSGGLLESILGSRMSSVLGALSSESGVGSGTVWKLMGFVAPLVMGAIGLHSRVGNLDARGLSGFLGAQKARLGPMLPAGVGSLLGAAGTTEGVREPGAVVPSRAMTPVRTAPPRSNFTVAWVVVGIAVILGALMMIGRGNRRMAQGRAPVTGAARRGTSALRQSMDTYFNSNEPSQRFVLNDSDANGNDLSAELLAHPGSSVTIESVSVPGRGQVAMQRARDLKDRLVSQGVSADRINTQLREENGRDHLEVVVSRSPQAP